MATGRHSFLILGATLLVALGSIVGWQASVTTKLQEELSTQCGTLMQAPDSSLHDTASSRADGERAALRVEVARLRREVEAAEGVEASAASGGAVMNHWTNAGGATPLASFESIFWAATGGDVSELGKWITFEPEAEAEAGRFLAGLPAAMRMDFPDARRLVATMMAARLPLAIEGAELVAETVLDPETTALRLRLSRSTGRSGEIILRFRRSAQGWQLLVPAQVIEGYRYLLTGG